jgi:hypothetical protein
MNDEMTNPARLLALLHQARDEHDEAARTALNQLLRENADARSLLPRLLVDEQALVSHLRDQSIVSILNPESPATKPRPQPAAQWFSWRSLVVAAASLVFGVFCTSVFAYVLPVVNKSLALLEESFESLSPPQASGVPTFFSKWSGDFAEVVGSQNGVVPRRGEKMWRFLRADNHTEAEASASYVGEAIYAIDLQPLRSTGVKAGTHIEISAWFAHGEIKPESRQHWNIKAAAFEGSVAEAPELWLRWNEASTSLAQRDVAAEAPGRWQRVSVTMELPANADFLVFECAVVQRHPVLTSGVAEFPAHYVDDVRVRLLPPTPVSHEAE